MTKKDYELIAYAMKSVQPKENWLNKRNQWQKDCISLSDHLYKTSKYTLNGNKSFKKDMFLKLCGF